MMAQGLLIILIIVTVGFNTLAQVLLKAGAGKSLLNIFLLEGIAMYGLSTILYIGLLGKLNLSFAYPLIIGLTVIATTIAGASLFQEKVEPGSWIGIGLMISGIWAIMISKK
jgi:multidrug transporter EmrE-like cation transporter